MGADVYVRGIHRRLAANELHLTEDAHPVDRRALQTALLNFEFPRSDMDACGEWSTLERTLERRERARAHKRRRRAAYVMLLAVIGVVQLVLFADTGPVVLATMGAGLAATAVGVVSFVVARETRQQMRDLEASMQLYWGALAHSTTGARTADESSRRDRPPERPRVTPPTWTAMPGKP
jgi:Flp pilus assembly protein TadB